jgi:hypothetical protein
VSTTEIVSGTMDPMIPNEAILRGLIDYSLKTMCKMRERKVLSKIQVENNHEEGRVCLIRIGQLPPGMTTVNWKEINFIQKVLLQIIFHSF